MIIENGKRYVRADGEISGVIVPSGNPEYPHKDSTRWVTYTKNGYQWPSLRQRTDLVSEYVEPCIECGNGARIMPCPVCSNKPEPPSPHKYGPWIPWTGGECPVADAMFGTVECVFDTGDERYIRENGKEFQPISKWHWNRGDGGAHIIYYRVLIEEPEAVKHTLYLRPDGGIGLPFYDTHRKAIITVQGDKLEIEWAPKEDKE